MDFALQPHTTAGARFVALFEQHAADFATRADQHDREGSFLLENIEAMQRSSVIVACVPARCRRRQLWSLETNPQCARISR